MQGNRSSVPEIHQLRIRGIISALKNEITPPDWQGYYVNFFAIENQGLD